MSLIDELKNSDVLEIKYNTTTYNGTMVAVKIKKKEKGYSATIMYEKAPKHRIPVGNKNDDTLDDLWKEIRMRLNG